MICPFCLHENLQGVDNCEKCGEELNAYDVPRGGDTGGGKDVGVNLVRTPISKVPAPKTVTVLPIATLGDVVERMHRGDASCVVISSTAHGIEGIFTERDLLMKVGCRLNELKGRPISEYMTPNPETLGPDASVAWVLNRMDVGGFRHIPIVQEGRPVCIISVTDILRFLADRYPKVA